MALRRALAALAPKLLSVSECAAPLGFQACGLQAGPAFMPQDQAMMQPNIFGTHRSEHAWACMLYWMLFTAAARRQILMPLCRGSVRFWGSLHRDFRDCISLQALDEPLKQDCVSVEAR